MKVQIKNTDRTIDVTEWAESNNRIVNDIMLKAIKWKSVSEKQVAFVEKLIAEEKKPKGTLVEGRREITGTIISTKIKSSFNGERVWKMVVEEETDDGPVRVYGTIPFDAIVEIVDAMAEPPVGEIRVAAIYDGATILAIEETLKGADITYVATVKRSKEDPSFGFASRPKLV